MARKSVGPWFWTGKNCWYAWVNGRQVSLRTKGRENEEQAVRAWHRLMADMPVERPETAPQGPKAVPPVAVCGPTVAAVVAAFLTDAESRLKPSTVRLYREDLAKLPTAIRDMPADGLTGDRLSKWLYSLAVSSTTKAITLRSVSACFGWAVKAGMMTANPATAVGRPESPFTSNGSPDNGRTAHAVAGSRFTVIPSRVACFTCDRMPARRSRTDDR